MTHTELKDEWAWSQVEAYADGSLARAENAMMREALARDPKLAAAVARARDVRRALSALGAPAAPGGLLRRLLGIPSGSGSFRLYSLAVPGLALALAFALAVAIWIAPSPNPEPVDDRRAVAVQEFALAMAYLQKAAVRTQQEVNGAVVFGLREAVSVGSDALHEDKSENGG